LNNVFCSREKHGNSDATHSESTSLGLRPSIIFRCSYIRKTLGTQNSYIRKTLGTHMINLDAILSYLLEVHVDFIISDRAVYFML
jgi:hypothetical protein